MRRRRTTQNRPATAVQTIDRRLIADVENLATTAADTAHRLNDRGLHELALPLTEALERLGRKRR